ncbi:GntR family transcriptional regulator [Klugiella xanthotipulae]|uniref:GntR family transcriptional regulator n=1 Tax=Klugiella xanthotipulae TaxID=244735 RepID=A0A543HYX5_9MICO|nr:GntR family transcriptional regulator [Klugiella xanthotipulae]TQM63518.1 GntR family transcriptional regulator [Klugiella xanthotipulae]
MTSTTLSKAQRAYQHLREEIASGGYAPGHRLVLDQLARTLDMSPVPVREALRMLEAEGLIEYQRNVGATVSVIDTVEYHHTMQTLSIIEGAATALALGSITPEDIETARAVNERMRAALTDFAPALFTQLNHEFHSVLFERCPNPHLLDLARKGWENLARQRETTFSFVPGRAAQSVGEHDNILHLIETGAPADEVEKAARAHRTNTLEAFLAHRPDPLH